MRRRYGLAVYFIAACFLRGADSAAIIGIVLVSQHLRLGSATGLLAACITLPHLAGPLAAQLLDRSRSKRTVIAAAGAIYGLALGAAVVVLPVSVLGAAIGLLLAGSAGPLLTGGLSSQLRALVRGDEDGRGQRRAQGLDAFTYGVAATVGPAVVGIIAATTMPMTGVLTAAAAAVVGGGIVLALPRPNANADTDKSQNVVGILSAVALLFRRPGLRRTTTATALTAVPLGAVPLLAVATANSLSVPSASSATLTAAYGLGNLVVSAILILVPLRGGADRLVKTTTAVLLVPMVCGLFVVGLPVSTLVFAALGAATGLLFTASLAARAAYAPPGAEAQVFVSMAGIKVAFSSIGAAVAGLLLPVGGPALFALATGIVAGTLLLLVLDRRPAT